MKTLLINFHTLVLIGMVVIFYIWGLKWSVENFIGFKVIYGLRKKQKKTSKEYRADLVTWNTYKYTWQQIVSILVYPLLWTPLLLIIIAFFGGIIYFLFDILRQMIGLLS